ncbi:MAG: hypothetical protein R2824_36065 [Saprospiraceae bacterium]|nr:hypothetical protein [Lewinella sp.]
MWFEKLVGFREIDPDQVRSNLLIEGKHLISKVNGKRYQYGTLEIPRLRELREQSTRPEEFSGSIRVSEIVGDVLQLHRLHEKSVFQAASQFNLLEMVNPQVTPEEGVAIYENDFTQGPACAIACGAGTIYRNYFVEIDGGLGQSRERQIDCLSDLGEYFNNKEQACWTMQNGYALVNREGLTRINNTIKSLDPVAYEVLKGKLRIGLQLDTEVTIDQRKNTVTQAYCSALPIGYSQVPAVQWEPFARLILEATYEATFYAALRHLKATGNDQLFLTLVGGGVFGNPLHWILDAIEKTVLQFKHVPLDVKIVSYGASNPGVKRFLAGLNMEK